MQFSSDTERPLGLNAEMGRVLSVVHLGQICRRFEICGSMRSGKFLDESLIGTGCLGLFGMKNSPQSVSDGLKTDKICQFENHRLQKFTASSLGPLLVRCPSES